MGINARGATAARTSIACPQTGTQLRQPSDCHTGQPLRLAHNLLVLAALRGGQENIDHILDRPHGSCEQGGWRCHATSGGSLRLRASRISYAEPLGFSLLAGDKSEQK